MLRAWKRNRWSHKNPPFLTFGWRIRLAGGTVILVCISSLWRLLISCTLSWWCLFFLFLVIIAANVEASSPQASISPADLHGMWYPTVRRTLVCLSKLYRCIDVSPVHFSQMVLSYSCSFIHLYSVLLFATCFFFAESSLPRFISRSLICLHPVPA